MQIERQWALLKSLPDHRNPRSTEQIWRIVVTDMHDVTKRTVERDLEYLASIFPIGLRSEGRTNYWYWEDNAKMWIPGLSDDEALTLHMTERNLNSLLPEGSMAKLGPYFSAARERLESQAKSIRPWTKKFRLIAPGQYLRPPSMFPEAVRIVRDALLRDKQLTLFVSRSIAEDALPLLANPLALIQQGNNFYLIFTRPGSQSPEHVRLHHIHGASVSMSKFDGPMDFDPDAYILSGALTDQGDLPIALGDWIEFSGSFSQHIGDLLNETPLAKNQRSYEEGDGVVWVKATVRFTSDFVDWILSLGPDVRVSHPASLRRYIAKRVAQTALLYAGEEDKELPMRTMRWFEYWKTAQLTCDKCGWQGVTDQSALEPSDGDSSSASECRCPKCSRLLLTVEYSASLDELMANWNTLDAATKGAILSRQERMERVEVERLKSPSELPDLKSGPNFFSFKLTWHPDPEVSYSVWHGNRPVWIQPALWEGHAEFLRIAEILHARYGDSIRDIRPTPAARGFLIGNDPAGKANIERARKLLGQHE